MEFLPNRIKRRIPTEVEGIGKLRPYLEPASGVASTSPARRPLPGKLCPAWRAAIEQVG